MPCAGREVTERVSALVTIHVKPYHEQEFEYELEIDNRGKKTAWHRLVGCTSADLAAVVPYLLNGSPKVHYKAFKVRDAAWQFWRPRNRMDALATDWLRLPVLPLALALLPLGGILGEDAGPAVFLPNLLLFGAAGFALYWVLRRKAVGAQHGQAVLRAAESDAGGRLAGRPLRRRRRRRPAGPAVRTALSSTPRAGFRSTLETIWYWGLTARRSASNWC